MRGGRSRHATSCFMPFPAPPTRATLRPRRRPPRSPDWGCRSVAGSVAPWSETASSGSCARPSGRSRRSCPRPAITSSWPVRRHPSSRAEGASPPSRRSCASSPRGRGLRSERIGSSPRGGPGSGCAGAGAAPDLPGRDLAGSAGAMQVPPDVLDLRGRGDSLVRHTAGPGPCRVAPVALQSVERRRDRPGGGPTAVSPSIRPDDSHPLVDPTP